MVASGGTRGEAAVVQVEKVDRAVGVGAVVGQNRTRDTVGSAELTEVRCGRRNELTRGTGGAADSGSDLLVVRRTCSVVAGHTRRQTCVGAGEAARSTGVAGISNSVGPEPVGTGQQAGGVVEVEFEAIGGEPAGETVGGGGCTGFAPAAEHALVVGDVAVLSVGAGGVAPVGPVDQEVVGPSKTGAGVALRLGEAETSGAVSRTGSAGHRRNVTILGSRTTYGACCPL